DERAIIEIARFVGRLPGAATPDEIGGDAPAAQRVVTELHAPLTRDADFDEPILVVIRILFVSVAGQVSIGVVGIGDRRWISGADAIRSLASIPILGDHSESI